MAYFANGTEGYDYMEAFCERCVNFRPVRNEPDDPTCPIIELHFDHNYEEADKEESFLHVLIPRNDETGEPEECRMFIDRQTVQELDLGPKCTVEALARWREGVAGWQHDPNRSRRSD